MSSAYKAIVNLLFEVGILAKTPRSGFYFLGSGTQSVAEHVHRTVYIGYVLAKLDGKADVAKVMEICLFHDLAESRTSDLNYVHQKYTQADEQAAIDDLTKPLPFGAEMKARLDELKARGSQEALLAKDADQIEFILSLKEQSDTGNTRADTWIPSAVKRLKTPHAKALAKMILKTPSDNWWFADKEEEWWITRRGKTQSKRY